jgi:hypothetical protein
VSDPIRQLSFWQSPVFLLNSRLGHFSATSCVATRRLPFSRSYRVNLPSSLAVIHSSTLEYSSRLPVSVYGTGCCQLVFQKLFLEAASPVRLARRLSSNALFRQNVQTTLLRHFITLTARAGILTGCPSSCACRLALRPRLTLR